MGTEIGNWQSLPSTPASCRLPCWQKHDEEHGSGTGGAAIAILSELLTRRIGPEREDLEYVIHCIEDLTHRQKEKPTTRKSNCACDKDAEKDAQDAWAVRAFGGSVYKPPKLKTIVSAIQVRKRLANPDDLVSLSLVDMLELHDAPELRAQFEGHLDSWTDFNVFRVAELTDGKPLQSVALSVMHRRNLLQPFRIDLQTLCNFLFDVELAYNPLPYHSSMHAADAIQGVHVLMTKFPTIQFSDLELLASFFAIAVHDVGHPGLTNDFRVADGDEGALTYNDKSVNEHCHSALAFAILRKQQNNWLCNLTTKQVASVRKLVVDMVLGSDMSLHFRKLKSFKDLTESKGADMSSWDFESHPEVLEMIVHSADISNPSRTFPIAKGWADRVLEEFFAQGDRERDLGRTLSPLCDRTTVKLSQSQIGFVNFVVLPTYEALGAVIDTDLQLANLKSYVKHWENEQAAAQPDAIEQKQGER